LAGAGAERRLDGATEARPRAGATEERELDEEPDDGRATAGAAEERLKTGALDTPRCHESDGCSGYVVLTSGSELEYFDGATHRATGRCVP
jgi:hypothetical protein